MNCINCWRLSIHSIRNGIIGGFDCSRWRAAFAVERKIAATSIFLWLATSRIYELCWKVLGSSLSLLFSQQIAYHMRCDFSLVIPLTKKIEKLLAVYVWANNRAREALLWEMEQSILLVSGVWLVKYSSQHSVNIVWSKILKYCQPKLMFSNLCSSTGPQGLWTHLYYVS